MNDKLLVEKEWLNEPNEEYYIDRGYACHIWRHTQFGTLCGYVGLPKDHPYYGMDYKDIENDGCFNVHGGLTFSGFLHSYNVDISIPENDLFWIGFDCAHLGDIQPWIYKPLPEGESLESIAGWNALVKSLSQPLPNGDAPTYKNIAFVKQNIKNIVDRLIEIKEQDGK